MVHGNTFCRFQAHICSTATQLLEKLCCLLTTPPPSPILLSKAMFPWDRPVYQLACQPHDGTPKEHQTVHARMVAVQVRPCSEVHTLSCGHTHAHGLKIIASCVLLSKGIFNLGKHIGCYRGWFVKMTSCQFISLCVCSV